MPATEPKLFFIFTRGRTGSTVIADDLNNHPEIVCYQELFRRLVWQPVEYERVDGYTKYCEGKGTGVGIDEYVEYLIRCSEAARPRLIGCKILSQHIEERKNLGLWEFVTAPDRKLLYLLRSPVRAALSGVIAAGRKLSNLRRDHPKFHDWITRTKEPVRIDIERLLGEIHVATYWAGRWRDGLQASGADFIELRYEDYMRDREMFLRTVCGFLGVEFLSCWPESKYMKLTPDDVWEAVANKEEVVAALEAEGIDVARFACAENGVP